MTPPESKGIARFRQERDQYRNLYELFRSSVDPELQHVASLGKLISEARGRIVRAHEEGELGDPVAVGRRQSEHTALVTRRVVVDRDVVACRVVDGGEVQGAGHRGSLRTSSRIGDGGGDPWRDVRLIVLLKPGF